MIIYTKKDCPMCHVAKLKLNIAEAKYEECQDQEKMKELGLRSLPALELDDGTLMKKFSDIIDYIKGLQD